MQGHRYFVLVFVLAVALLESACSTVIKPTRPTEPLEPVGQVSRFRFDGEFVQLREPGMPLASSRAWQREVQNYTASTLNELLDTDEMAPPVQTIVVFDLASPGAFQLGTWKEMTIELTTMLPSGRVVRSEPITGNIDDAFEWFAVNGMAFTGSALDVVAAIASLLFVFTGEPWACGMFIGALVVGLSLNLGQSLAAFLVASSEETRWSNLYQRALTQHARDIERALATAPPTSAPPPAGAAPPQPSTTPPAPYPAPPSAPPSAPAQPSTTPPASADEPPPPPLLDPADGALAPEARLPTEPAFAPAF